MTGASDLLILCYHAVSSNWLADLSVTPELLDHHLRLLVRRGYRGNTFTEAATDPSPQGKVAVITFDDGYRSVLQLAQPILQTYSFPATVFVPTNWPGLGKPMSWPGIARWLEGVHESELYPLDWSELAHLLEKGWEIGSHTCSHPHLTHLDDAELDAELFASRSVIEDRLGRPCQSIAYPYGDVDLRVAAAAKRAGYTAAATLPRTLERLDDLRIPRVGVYRIDTPWRFQLKVSPLGRRLRSGALASAWINRGR